MSTIEQMKANVRQRLGEPIEQKPSDGQILLALTTQIQSYLNETNLSAKPWAVSELNLSVSAGIEDYALNVPNFGKPIQVRTVYPANPAHIERDIDFFELQDLNFDWNLPKNFGNTFFNLDGSPHTALRMAFFRKDGLDTVYVRVLPIPQLAATYQILYQIGVYGQTTTLGQIPVLPQHHALIEIRTAISVLPMTSWTLDDEDFNTNRRKEFALSLGVDLARLEKQFNDYIKTVTVSRRFNYRGDAFSID